ncbi:hypothetical protein [Mastigocoleus sp. MO_188.B34]|nr:hypothetical protein [Mastigocoleus sp. MO_188.B34]
MRSKPPTSICYEWGLQNGYAVEEFGCVPLGSGVERVKIPGIN